MNRLWSSARRRAHWLIGVVGLGTIGSAPPALAQARHTFGSAPPGLAQAQRTFHLVYRAPRECPNRTTFIGWLARRVPLSWVASDASSAPTFTITLEADPDEFVARMEGNTAENGVLLRTVRAKQCEEAVSGIALVTALAMEAQVTSPAEADVERSAEVVQPAAKPSADVVARATPKPKENQPAAQAPIPPAAPPNQAEAKRHPWFAQHELAVRFALSDGVGPAIAKGAGVEWGIGALPLLPILRVAASWNESRSAFSNQEDDVQFRVIAGELDGCLGWTMIGGPRLIGAACVGVELGRYTAQGLPADPTRVRGSDYRMLWASGVGSLHLRTAGAGVFLDVAPVLRIPWVRREFVAIPSNVTIHGIPALALGATFSLGMTFD